MMEEIPSVTFDFGGEELKEWQVIQQLYLGGFTDPRVLLVMWAIIEGESGSYMQAWHINCQRTPAPEKAIIRYVKRDGAFVLESAVPSEPEYMKVLSIDLGFAQFNVDVAPDQYLEMAHGEVGLFVQDKFEENPRLQFASTSSQDAHAMYLRRGFQPWYAYKPGTLDFKLKKRRACKGLGNWLARTQVGRMEIDGNDFPHLDFDSEAL